MSVNRKIQYPTAGLRVIQSDYTVYWFTVEFGLCREADGIKALGAGIMSSYGELENAFSEKSEKRPFVPNITAIQPYDDVGYQLVYFVCESIERMEQQFRQVGTIPGVNDVLLFNMIYLKVLLPLVA
ncbi:unnamed protein product [Echinostoma caproni]|uniref:BH4_AAA_HYDROXYL_2 domain-containing protein n=1 Tax=Echinostoma caproni TaxID=27848 RepID=A0A183AJ31_9TREM|nr:unnamed protein product [Echinostoma caproni]